MFWLLNFTSFFMALNFTIFSSVPFALQLCFILKRLVHGALHCRKTERGEPTLCYHAKLILETSCRHQMLRMGGEPAIIYR